MISFAIPLYMEKFTFLFFVCAFIGWFCESLLESASEKKLLFRGVLRIPFCPTFGFGALLILPLGLHFAYNVLLLFLLTSFVCTVLEYITALILEKAFNRQFWDYSRLVFTQNCHYKNRIALTSSLWFGVLSMLVIYVLWPFTLFCFEMFGDLSMVRLNCFLLGIIVTGAIKQFAIYLTPNKKSDMEGDDIIQGTGRLLS